MALRPCLGYDGQRCGKLTAKPRCPTHQRMWDQGRYRAKGTRYHSEWQRHSKALRAEHIQAHGYTCPGYQRAPHPSTDLVVDHDLGVICRACNAVKANTHDRNKPTTN